MASGRFSNTNRAIRSDDDFSSIGYSDEGQDHGGIDAPPQATVGPSCSHVDHDSSSVVFDAGSPGQTLASLKAEAMEDRIKPPCNKRGRFAHASTSRGTKREVTRTCKIMKEAYFNVMELTRIFVSGPVDPK